MATLLRRIHLRLAALRAPGTAPTLPPAPTLASEPEPLPCLEELDSALFELSEARAEQEAIIATAGDRKENLLADDGADDSAILGIDAGVQRAHLALDRLESLETEARAARVDAVWRMVAARWQVNREIYCAKMREFYELTLRWQQAANGIRAVRQTLFAHSGAPDWNDVVPEAPILATRHQPLAPFNLAEFNEIMARFSTLSLTRETSTPNAMTAVVADYVGGNGDAAGRMVATFGEIGDIGKEIVVVALRRPLPLTDGRVLPRGVSIKVRASIAKVLVSQKRAALAETVSSRVDHRELVHDVLPADIRTEAHC